MKIRRADFPDYPVVMKLVFAFFQQLPENEGKETITLEGKPLSPELCNNVLRFICSSECLTLLGETDGVPTGLFIAELIGNPWTEEIIGKEQMIYIAPSERNGLWLYEGLKQVQQWLRANHATKLIVAPTKSKNNAMFAELLTRHGFTDEGVLLRKTYE